MSAEKLHFSDDFNVENLKAKDSDTPKFKSDSLGGLVKTSSFHETLKSDIQHDRVKIIADSLNTSDHDLREGNLFFKCKKSEHSGGSSVIFSKGREPRISVGGNPPQFNRSPHVITASKVTEITLPRKEHIGEKPEFNWVSTILPPLLMTVVMIIMFIFLNLGSLFFTVPMYSISIVIGVINYKSQKKKYYSKLKSAEDNFYNAQVNVRNIINNCKREQADFLVKEYPDIARCCQIVKSRSSEMWRIRSDEEFFLDLRLGMGEVKSNLKLQGSYSVEENENIVQYMDTLKNVPVSIPVNKYKSVGVVGDRQTILKQVRSMIIQATVNQGYDELKIVIFYSKDEVNEWKWARWLPHIWDNDRQNRYMAYSSEDSIKLCKELEEIYDRRKAKLNDNESDNMYFLVIVADRKLISNQPLMQHITGEETYGFNAIFMSEDRGRLPSGCKAIIENKNESSFWYPTTDKSDKHVFRADIIGVDICDKISRSMAPVRLIESGSTSKLPNSISFMEAYGVRKVDDFNIAKRWKQSDYGRSLSVPIGIKSNGEEMLFDINEHADGPHGMVSGAAGSGKSDIVQSWILSMALTFRPTEVSFIIVDYKGDGLLAPFRKLPHLVGTISNLDHKVERNVTALNSELIRRQELFKECGAHNIEDYIEQYKHGKMKTPLPYLIIIIDEFADFKANHPEFMPIINAIYTKGRSLGVYAMVLAQDVASAASGSTIEVNSNFRWSMKVNSADASMGILGTHDAYTMPKLPGRGYVKIGNFEVYEKIQAFWSGAYYNPEINSEINKIPPVSRVTEHGKCTPVISDSVDRDKEMGTWTSTKEIDVVVSYIEEYVSKNAIEVPKQVWQPPLPKDLLLDDLLHEKYSDGIWPENTSLVEMRLGVADDPVLQKQHLLSYKFNSCGHVSIQGGPESGKTTALLTGIRSLVERYSPENLELYLFDYDKWTLNLMNNLPHVKGNTAASEPDEIRKMVAGIKDELNIRKAMFLKKGAVSLEGFCQMGKSIPSIILVIDNITAAWDDIQEVQELLYEVAQKGAGYGIYLVATAPGATFPYKLVNYFKTKISLVQNEKSDYVSIVGRTELTPETYPGRGLAKIEHPVEIQIARPVSGENEVERNSAIHEMTEKQKKGWNNSEKTEETSNSFMLDNMDELKKAGEIVFGLDKKKMEPAVFDRKDKHTILISSKKQDVLDKILANTIDQVNVIDKSELIIFDDKRGNLNKCMCTGYYCIGDADINTYIDSIMPRLQDRYEGKDRDEYDRVAPIYLLIADWKEFFDFVDDKTIKCLEDVVDMGKGLSVYLIVAGLGSGITGLATKGETLTHRLIKQKQIIITGGSIYEHNLFMTSMSSEDENADIPDGMAYYMNDKSIKRIYLM